MPKDIPRGYAPSLTQRERIMPTAVDVIPGLNKASNLVNHMRKYKTPDNSVPRHPEDDFTKLPSDSDDSENDNDSVLSAYIDIPVTFKCPDNLEDMGVIVANLRKKRQSILQHFTLVSPSPQTEGESEESYHDNNQVQVSQISRPPIRVKSVLNNYSINLLHSQALSHSKNMIQYPISSSSTPTPN